MKLFSLIILASSLFNLPALHKAGFRGEGMTIAVIDAGFFHANDSTVFPQDRILGSYDLLQGDSLAKPQPGMFDDPTNIHGTMVLSTMLHDSIGTAPQASFYLIRSEDTYAEYYGEVERLARAFRLADSLDVDIVTVSLGYYKFNPVEGDTVNPMDFTYADMDGSSVAAQAATQLARNGRFVVLSAGNEGNKPWHYISTPADADSILTVGAVDSVGEPAYFTSWGPTSDGRLKPEVSALGYHSRVYVPNVTDTLGHFVGAIDKANGTSFSAPETAGMAACLWQALPNLTAMELRELIMQSSSLYPSYDYQRGYGEPDAWKAYTTATNLPLIGEESSSDAPRRHILITGQGPVLLVNGQHYSLLGIKISR